MNANYLYDVFETGKVRDVSLDIALEIVKGEKPLPDDMTTRHTNAFVGLHFDLLRRAYQTGNRKLFADILKVCEEGREHEAEALLSAEATGNEKLMADMEALHGEGK